MKNYETNVYDYIDSKTGAHVVKVVTTYEGKAVYAYAKCDPEDQFDLEFGTQLALKRLDIKVAQKRAAHALEYAKACQQTLNFLKNEHHRVKKAVERAEIAILDRRLEIKEFEKEIAEMLG
jgi:hypothetical protein